MPPRLPCLLPSAIAVAIAAPLSAQPIPSGFADPANQVAIPFVAAVDGAAFVPPDLDRSANPLGGAVRAIINDDGRTPMLSDEYPWSTIGRVDWVDDRGGVVGSCTGTLVGLDLVLTNAHCLLEEASDRPTQHQIVFRPNLRRGQARTSAEVVDYAYGDSPYSGRAADDWALLRLNRPLGDTYGFLGWRSLDFRDDDLLTATAGKVSIVGYAGDFPTERLRSFGAPGETAGLSEGCSVLLVMPEGELADTLVHDCDTNAGASGGPILARFDDGEYYIVGLHSGSITLLENITLPSGDRTDILNRGVQVQRWAATAAAMR
ncbi:MAG: trypsin-like peptidase domain-containing protein [Leptolyngbya sp.]|nr:trypsin-like peptidase domain-containing protein [Leptolyngbya sp.]